MAPTPGSTFEQLIAELSQIVKQSKSQTGDLTKANDKIDSIDRALRGSNGDRGLIARMILIEESLARLADMQIPEVLQAVKNVTFDVGNVKADIGAVRSELTNHKLKTENDITILRAHVDSTLSTLRKDFDEHLQDEEEAEKREEKDKTKFGGAEWFRQNASSILVAVIQLIITTLVTVYFLKQYIPTP